VGCDLGEVGLGYRLGRLWRDNSVGVVFCRPFRALHLVWVADLGLAPQALRCRLFEARTLLHRRGRKER
jgi:hypothetical protein